jgi:hypothetical protein
VSDYEYDEPYAPGIDTGSLGREEYYDPRVTQAAVRRSRARWPRGRLLPDVALGDTAEQLADGIELAARKLYAEAVEQHRRQQDARNAADLAEMKSAARQDAQHSRAEARAPRREVTAMVFDPSASKYALPPEKTWAAKQAELRAAIAPTPKYHSGRVEIRTVPENVDGLAQNYGWVGLDPAEAKKVPKP